MQRIQSFPVAIAILLTVAGCTNQEPRGKEYFDAHLDQGRQVVAGRKDGSSRGEEYANADLAMQEADAKERLKRFFGK